MHEQFGTNKVHEWSLPGGDVEAGFAEADVIVERSSSTTGPRGPRSSPAACWPTTAPAS